MTAYSFLLKIKGIGHFQASQICDSLGISKQTKYEKLSPSRLENLNRLLANIRKNATSQFKLNIEHGLIRERQNAIQRLIKINCYRGRRIKQGFPARGQRTRSNALTATKRLNN